MQIDFYVLADQHNTWHKLLAQLCNKAIAMHQLWIHSQDRAQADEINDYLWTFNDISFLPHSLADSPDDAPIKIGFDAQQSPDQADILINFADDIPSWFTQFNRVIEIVHSENKASSRQHYKFYKDQGYQVQSHNI